jgi:hypothetical protein
MVAESTDPDMPRVTGALKIDRNILHFRYQVDGTGVNGYSIISRKRNVCYTYGAHYDGSTPLMTWTAMVNKKVRMKKN